MGIKAGLTEKVPLEESLEKGSTGAMWLTQGNIPSRGNTKSKTLGQMHTKMILEDQESQCGWHGGNEE